MPSTNHRQSPWLTARNGRLLFGEQYENARPLLTLGGPITEIVFAFDAAPEVGVMTEKGRESLESEEALWSLPGISNTPAGANRQVITVDDLALLGFGPRRGMALDELTDSFAGVEVHR